ncbi:MAG: HlyC/CorC family transporter [Spirochaetales bacterium]|nr:HlyC/CorC family transporter [Spirochaetales bacterium]
MIYLEIVVCLSFAAFFAGLETGLLSADQFDLYTKKDKQHINTLAADFLLLKPERLLGTTLIGTNLAVVTAAVLLSSHLRRIGLLQLNWLGTLLLSIIFLIFSEIIPKSFFRKYANTVSIKFAPLVVFFYFLFFPFLKILNFIVKIFLTIIGKYKKNDRVFSSKEDLRILVKLASREAGVSLFEQGMIDDIFDFREKMAREVMIPLHALPVVEYSSSFEDIYKTFLNTHMRYIAVSKKRTDNIIGYVDVEDIIYEGAKDIKKVMKKSFYYPETKRVALLFQDMIQQKKKVVFLSDEYGGTSGMITITEIASEIIGYFPGEVKEEFEDIRRIGRRHYIVSGTVGIDELYHKTDIKLQEGAYDTVGGFLSDKLGKIPEKGVTAEIEGLFFRVLDRDDRHVKSVEILKRVK